MLFDCKWFVGDDLERACRAGTEAADPNEEPPEPVFG